MLNDRLLLLLKDYKTKVLNTVFIHSKLIKMDLSLEQTKNLENVTKVPYDLKARIHPNVVVERRGLRHYPSGLKTVRFKMLGIEIPIIEKPIIREGEIGGYTNTTYSDDGPVIDIRRDSFCP